MYVQLVGDATKQRLIFAFQTSIKYPTSAISLSMWVKIGLTPYLSRRHFVHAVNAFMCFPGSIAVAVDNKQYVNGKPALSYSAMTLYNSRCLEFVLSIHFC